MHHSVTGPWATYESIRDYHKSLGWGGFAYTYAVYPDGSLIVAGPVDFSRSCVAGLNHIAVCTVFIGDFTSQSPTQLALQTGGWVKALINTRGYGHETLGHRDFPNQSTACPGAVWPGWFGDVYEASLNADIRPSDGEYL